MLEALRQRSRSYLIWIAFGVIIIVFIFFFGPQTAGFGPGSAQLAGTFAGEKIYDSQINATLERARMRTGSRGRLDDAEYYARKREVLIDIGLVHLLAERAQDAGIAVSDDEVFCYIVNWNRDYTRNGEKICRKFPLSYPDRYPNYDFGFYSEPDGSFSSGYENDVRAQFNMAANEYEDFKEHELLAVKYLELLEQSVPMGEEIVRDIYERRASKVELAFIALDPESVEAPPISDEMVATFIEESADQIAAYYDEHEADYYEPRSVQLRRIYVRKPSDDAGIESARARVELLEQRVTEGGEDFEAVVLEETELDREREQGGDMGMRTAETLSETLYNATDGMEIGDVKVVEETYAWSIVKLEDATEGRTPSLEEKQAEIARTLLTESQTERVAQDLARRGERILEIAASGTSLEDAAAQEGREYAAELEGITVEAYIERQRAEAAAAAAEAAAGEDDTGEDEDEDDGEDEADPSDGVMIEAELPVPPTALDVQTTGLFARERPGQVFGGVSGLSGTVRLPPTAADNVPRIGASRDLMRAAFELTEDAPLIDELIEVGGKEYVVRLASRETPAEEIPSDQFQEIYDAARAELARSLLGIDGARRRLLLYNDAADRGPLLEEVLEHARVDGDYDIEEDLFEFDAAPALLDEGPPFEAPEPTTPEAPGPPVP